MNITLDAKNQKGAQADCRVIVAFNRKKTTKKGKKEVTESVLVTSGWTTEQKESFESLKSNENFKGEAGSSFRFYDADGTPVYAIGLGEKSKANAESLRRAIAGSFKAASSEKAKSVSYDIDQLNVVKGIEKAITIVTETLGMCHYVFNKHKPSVKSSSIADVFLAFNGKKATVKMEKALQHGINSSESINYCRDLVNEAPNILHSEEYSKRIQEDVKATFKGKGVKVKVLNKAQMKKEKMNLFLSVNAGSGYEPQLVHLTYTPKKVTKNTKHIALVGKGITFDTGGYSLKPSSAISGMKFDMGGSATLYGAFRSAVLNDCPNKVTCILALTDNAVSSFATFPDSIVKARNGKTVEILNTDAEGRLILADSLDYAGDLKPDTIINAATLTGACLVALGTEVCALMGNDNKLKQALLKTAKGQDEYMWELPIIDEWRNDMKSDIADLKNIGSSRFAGTAKAAAFLENFIQDGIKWAHLDIAGVCDSQKHLPYCPSKGGSGVIVRTVADYLHNA